MRIVRFQPAAVLLPLVDCYWSAVLEGPALESAGEKLRMVPFLPSPGGLEIFVHLDAPFDLERGRTPFVHVSCWRTTTAPISAGSGARLFAIRVRAGMGPHLVRTPLPELADRFTDLADIWGPPGAQFGADLRAARDHRERVAIADSFLTKRLRVPGGRSIIPAVRRLERGHASIEALAEGAGLGLRQFEARFLAATGNPPARFRRLARLRRNIKALLLQDGPLVSLIDEGYFDQAQQIRDFKTFTGMTPGELRAELRAACHFYDLATQASVSAERAPS